MFICCYHGNSEYDGIFCIYLANEFSDPHFFHQRFLICFINEGKSLVWNFSYSAKIVILVFQINTRKRKKFCSVFCRRRLTVIISSITYPRGIQLSDQNRFNGPMISDSIPSAVMRIIGYKRRRSLLLGVTLLNEAIVNTSPVYEQGGRR